LLVPDDSRLAERHKALRLSVQLAKAGRRCAKPDAIRWIDRELAAWFGDLAMVVVLGSHIPQLVRQSMCSCRDAAAKRRGRPRLSRSLEEIDRLSFGDGNSDTRRRKKWVRRATGERDLHAWLERTGRRGETLLTWSEAPPQILPD
jgi:hypothetical protein